MNMTTDFQQGFLHQQERAFDNALACFKLLSERPDCRERALLEIAKTYKMMNKPAEAIDAFSALVLCAPGNDEGIRELGETARLSNQCEKAILVLDRMARAGTNDRVYLELCKMYCFKAETVKARAALESFTRSHPESSEINIELGKIYKKEGDYRRALGELEKVLVVSPDNHDAWYELGDTYYQLADYAKAVQCFVKITAGPRADKELFLKLVELYSLLGDAEKSNRAADAALRRAPTTPFGQDAMLSEIEILQRKTVLSSRVKRLWVTVTTRCNIKCKTCGLWHSNWDLPYKTAQEVMALYPYLERIVWLGGEVFLYKHFEEMFDAAAKYSNLTQQIITNGVILNERWTEKIIASGNTELTFSVDGTTKEVYEEIRQGSDFEKLLVNIRRAMAVKKRLNSSINIRMNAVIMRTNYRQMEQLLDFARDEGFNQVSFMALHFNMAPEENIFYENQDKEILNFVGAMIPRLRVKAEEYGIDLDILLPPCEQESPCAEGEREMPSVPAIKCGVPSENAAPPLYCKRPWQYLMICDKGAVILTGSCVKPVGNIDTHSIAEIWNSPASQLYRKSMIDNAPEGICRDECRSRME